MLLKPKRELVPAKDKKLKENLNQGSKMEFRFDKQILPLRQYLIKKARIASDFTFGAFGFL